MNQKQVNFVMEMSSFIVVQSAQPTCKLLGTYLPTTLQSCHGAHYT